MSKSEQGRKQARGEEGVITVSRTMFNQTNEEKQYIQIRPFATEPAHVGVKLGRTINLGNYESARVEVLFDVPCYVEEATAVYKDVLARVGELLTEEVTKIVRSIHPEQSVEQSLEELI